MISLTRPGRLAQLRAGAFTWSALVEETLRYAPPVANLPLRYAVTDIDIAGERIKAGDAILACFAAANRDPHLHAPDPDEFDPTRPTKEHLSFGYGRHFCLGAPLARLEAAIALPALFDRFPDITMAGTPRRDGDVGQLHLSRPPTPARPTDRTCPHRYPHRGVRPVTAQATGRTPETTTDRLRHDNPHCPVRSPTDAVSALLLHDGCPWHCSTRVAAIIVSRDDFQYFRERGHIESDSWTTPSDW